MSKIPDMKALMQKTMLARVVFSSITIVPKGCDVDGHFTAFDSNMAEAFIGFRLAFPDADLSELTIHCKL